MLKYLETLTDDLNKNKSSFVMNSKIHYAQNELQIQCIAYGCKVRDLLMKKPDSCLSGHVIMNS